MLLFRGDTTRDWNEAYFAPATLTDRSGTLANVRDFHQVPDERGVRAVAVRRLFDAAPRRTDPGEAPRFGTAQAPYARYESVVSFGMPCWIARAACRTLDVPRR